MYEYTLLYKLHQILLAGLDGWNAGIDFLKHFIPGADYWVLYDTIGIGLLFAASKLLLIPISSWWRTEKTILVFIYQVIWIPVILALLYAQDKAAKVLHLEWIQEFPVRLMKLQVSHSEAQYWALAWLAIITVLHIMYTLWDHKNLTYTAFTDTLNGTYEQPKEPTLKYSKLHRDKTPPTNLTQGN